MEARSTPWPWVGILAATCIVLLLAAFVFTMGSRPLHADESVQWSLVRDLHEGQPYSVNQDRFHGPTLVFLTQLVSGMLHMAPNELGPIFLRAIPFCFGLSLVVLPWTLPGVSRRAATVSAVALLLAAGFGRYAGYYVQEVLLAAGFAWGASWWLRGAPHGHRGLLIASGGAFGFALACKVTALAYLLCFGLALLACRRRELTLRNLVCFFGGLLVSWGLFQSCFLTDLRGLGAWGHQLLRSFGVATGNDEGTLTIDSPLPWLAILLLWAALAGVRWCGFAHGRRFAHLAGDPAFFCATLILGFHLLLPYKTPWLLLTPTVLLVALVLPLGFEEPAFRRFSAWAYVALLIGFGLDRPFSNPGHTATSSETVRFAEEVSRMEQAYGAARFYVAIEGGHYWPLPYYLRSQKVGYGVFAGAERAPIRLLPMTDSSRPAVAGYEAFALPVRTGEFYWVLVAKGYESHFTALRGP